MNKKKMLTVMALIAALDESCMEAARLSGDDAMIEKVERLMRQ